MKSIENNFDNKQVNELLKKHFIELRSVSPEGSTHVLDIDGLKDPSIKFWSLWENNELMGCGALKFLNKLWGFHLKLSKITKELDYEEHNIINHEQYRKTNLILKEYSRDIENFKYNRAIAHIRSLFNQIEDITINKDNKEIISYSFKTLLQISFYFIPHITSEIWISYKYDKELHHQKFPHINEDVTELRNKQVVIQVNGKTRDVINVSQDLNENEIDKIIKDASKANKHLVDKKILKTIFIKNKIINYIIKN